MNVWRNDVFTAMERIGRPAPLSEIYKEVSAIRAARGDFMPKSTEAIIRRTIEQFSSSTTSFTGKEDLFESTKGIGAGVWAIRAGATLQVLTSHSFILNEFYNRRNDIHHVFGGGQQSGISPSRSSPFIFLFTGGSGEHYGYADSLNDDGSFDFFGEGQAGDMTFTKGNKAIRDHVRLKKDILLFESLGKGKSVRFLGEFVCESYREVIAKDRDSRDRKAFIFQLRRADENPASAEVPPQLLNLSLESLRQRAYEAATPTRKTTTRIVNVRERKESVKAYALMRAAGRCECCGESAPFNDRNGQPFLQVHHIRKLADNGLDTPENVAAITPNCHSRIHHSLDGPEIDKELAVKIAQKERSNLH